MLSIFWLICEYGIPKAIHRRTDTWLDVTWRHDHNRPESVCFVFMELHMTCNRMQFRSTTHSLTHSIEASTAKQHVMNRRAESFSMSCFHAQPTATTNTHTACTSHKIPSRKMLRTILLLRRVRTVHEKAFSWSNPREPCVGHNKHACLPTCLPAYLQSKTRNNGSVCWRVL